MMLPDALAADTDIQVRSEGTPRVFQEPFDKPNLLRRQPELGIGTASGNGVEDLQMHEGLDVARVEPAKVRHIPEYDAKRAYELVARAGVGDGSEKRLVASHVSRFGIWHTVETLGCVAHATYGILELGKSAASLAELSWNPP